MKKSTQWLRMRKTITPIKLLLANLSIVVRTSQFRLFKSLLKPKPSSQILDVGVTSDESLKDSNMFEKLYPHKHQITAATIEDPISFRKLYPSVKVKKITPHSKLPFKDHSFDIAVSWATIEHVGGYKDQEFFLNELLRTGKKIYLTTPYRGCIYEPHSGLFLLHWLPLKVFRKICSSLGKEIWSKEKYLNPLLVGDIKKMKLKRKVKTKVYKMFGFLPSHLIIYA